MLESHDSTPQRHPTSNHFKPNATPKFSLASMPQNDHPTDKSCLSLLGAPCPFPPRKRPNNRPILLNRHDSTPRHYPTPIHFKSSTSFMCSLASGLQKGLSTDSHYLSMSVLEDPPPPEKRPKHHPILFDCRNSTPQSHPTSIHFELFVSNHI